MDLKSLLTDYFCQEYNIDLSKTYEIEEVSAKTLITKHRIDLIAKWKYIEYKEKGYDLTFIKELYTAHIEAFSLGTFIEPGNDNKNSIEKYFHDFDFLINDIKCNGFDENISIIPVGSNNVIINGAHRVAIAAYYDLKVPIIRFNNISVSYDTKFFKDRLLDEKYIDFLVNEYCKIKENVYVACVWPKAKGSLQREKMNFLINKSCEVIYKKNVKLNYEGLRNLITQVYSEQDWIGCIGNGFSGAQNKVNACYEKSEIVTVYVLECDNFKKIVELKKNIRDIFQIGKNSIHITDTKFKAIRLVNLLLNNNSVNFLNTGKPYYDKNFNRMLIDFKKKLIDHNFSLNEFIIDSNSILAMYGLREANDIDFMTIAKEFKIIENDYIENHHDNIEFYQTSIDNLVLNPKNYFVYNDLKFVTLDVFRLFKKNRNEKRDQLDLKLIDSSVKRKINLRLSFYKQSIKIRRIVRNKKNKIVLVLRKIGIYDGLKSLYHYLKGIR